MSVIPEAVVLGLIAKSFESVVERIIASLAPAAIQKTWERIKKKKTGSEVEIKSVRRFWKMYRKSSRIGEPELREGMLITLKGTLSKYAPMIIGDPIKKRELHKEYRKKLSERKVEDTDRIDPKLSLTSGNTVWRIKIGDFVYLGLYQGIVRNSIPVFVKKEYYESIEGIFFKDDNPYCVDVVLTGSLGELSAEVVDKVGLVEKGSVYGLFVGNKGTKIEYLGEADYLDGDIWIALKDGRKEHMVSRFLDLGDIDDFEDELKKLKGDVKEVLSANPNSQVILQFDQVNRPIQVKQTIEIEDCWKKFWKF